MNGDRAGASSPTENERYCLLVTGDVRVLAHDRVMIRNVLACERLPENSSVPQTAPVWPPSWSLEAQKSAECDL